MHKSKKMIAMFLLLPVVAMAQGVREPEGVRQSGGGNDYNSKVNQYTCTDIKARQYWLSQLEKQPQTGRTMEWIKDEKRYLTDLDFQLLCK